MNNFEKQKAREYLETNPQILEGKGWQGLKKLVDETHTGEVEAGGDWREGCRSFGQLSSVPPRFLLSGLIPENALTAVPAPSYHCKTWWALQMGHAVSEGLPLFCFDAPEKVPVLYHVPEMNEALVRERMAMLGIEDSENFLVRPMELGIWSLKDPRMIESSKGRLVFLDTQGFFNEADDQNSYNQALGFAGNVFNLLNQGARAIVMLTHPPKYATQRLQKEPPWTLENSVIGSAAYGGILRSCLRVRNLNLDLNDKHPWIYVQGLKNPGLKPFQLEDIPLRMKAAPGESPYLHDLLAGIEDDDSDPRQHKAYEMFERGASNRLIIKELKTRNTKVTHWREQWKLERKEQKEADNDTLQ